MSFISFKKNSLTKQTKHKIFLANKQIKSESNAYFKLFFEYHECCSEESLLVYENLATVVFGAQGPEPEIRQSDSDYDVNETNANNEILFTYL
jgi:hypothetical protein